MFVQDVFRLLIGEFLLKISCNRTQNSTEKICKIMLAISQKTCIIDIADNAKKSKCRCGGMADALASGASARKGVWVQVPPSAPKKFEPICELP